MIYLQQTKLPQSFQCISFIPAMGRPKCLRNECHSNKFHVVDSRSLDTGPDLLRILWRFLRFRLLDFSEQLLHWLTELQRQER